MKNRESHQPLISVVVTTCNRKKKLLKRALDSVFAQSYRPLQLIVVNDAPEQEQELHSFLQETYQDEIEFFSNEVQSGACYSRNRGLEVAKGEFIAYLDDDDEWIPEKLEKQMKQMKDDTVLVYSDYSVKSDDYDVRPARKRTYPSGIVLEQLLASNFIGGSSVPLMKTSVLREIGGFDSSFRSCQDYDVWIRMAEKGLVAAVPEVLSYYYVWDESITGVFERRVQGWDWIFKKHAELYAKYPKSAVAFQAMIIEESVKRAYPNYALRIFLESFRYFPKNARCLAAALRGLLLMLLGIY